MSIGYRPGANFMSTWGRVGLLSPSRQSDWGRLPRAPGQRRSPVWWGVGHSAAARRERTTSMRHAERSAMARPCHSSSPRRYRGVSVYSPSVRRGLSVAALALLAAAVLWWLVGARRDLALDKPVTAEGPCRVVAEVVESGEVIDPSQRSGVFELPVEGTIRYTGSIDAPDPDRRDIEGEVAVDLPWPLGEATALTFAGSGGRLDQEGIQAYRLPWAIAPVGATATVRVAYREPGITCSGKLTAQLTGGLGDGLPRPAALATLALGGVGLALASRPRWLRIRDLDGVPTGELRRRGRPALGTAAGFVGGFGLGLALFLWSFVPLSSAALTLCPVLGAVAGGLVGRVAPWQSTAGRSTPPAPEPEAELQLVD